MVADNKYTFEIIGNDKSAAAFKSLASNVRSTVNRLGQIGGVAVAGLAIMVQQSTAANTEMKRLAESVGVGTQELSRWAHAAGTVNLEADKMADIFKDVQDKIGDFAITGGGGAADMFEKLNLDVKDFISLTPDKQLIKIGEALDGVQTTAEKIFFLEALAGDASRLLPLLDDNSKGLKELAAEADRLGVSITELDAAKLEAASRSFERVQAVAVGFANKVAVQVAPIVEVLVEKLVGVTTEGDRLGTAVQKGFEFAAKAAGVFADGLHGVRILIKGVETLARAMNFVLVGGFVKLIEIIADVANAIVDGLVFPIRKVLELAAPFSDLATDALVDLDALTDKIKIQVPAAMQAFADAQASAFDVARGELHELLMDDLPSTVIKANIDKVLAEADARAQQKVKEISAKLAASVAPPGGGVEDPRDVAERERIATSLARLDESHRTELEQIQFRLADELILITAAEEKKLLTEDDANARRKRAHEAFQLDMINLVTVAEKGRLAVIQGIGQLSDAFAQMGSKKAFKVAKALALAQAAVSLPAAIIDSYKNAGGYPWGIVPAIAMAATGLAQIKQIKSTQFGGGGGGGGGHGAGGGGRGGGPPSGQGPFTADVQNLGGQFQRDRIDGTQTIVQFNITGDVIGDKAENLLGEMRELIEGSDFIMFGPQSRQAQEIAEG